MKHLLTLLAALIALPMMAADFPKGSPNFSTDYKAALKQAKAENKPLVVVFSAVWCGPCQSMKKTVYPSKEVAPMHDKFVWAYLDVDVEANGDPARKYNVTGIPHIQFLDAKGKDIGNQIGGTSPGEFAGTLEKVLAKTAPKAE
ncbi:thioredoxin family protein [Prosthecobacter sp. SYSU 5D2]|uniref:thioredoxin family protein n=1 Tax=Prosthecobacter sp. SYSU 5D2 TaxID=3134134 RepID=UPI0031FF1464